ncbi:endonuclease, partial [Streptococcus vicugnae]
IRGAVTTQFSNLYDGTDGKNLGDKFYIPENVYIIGTMNDIDRSVDTFDFAMRRRFRFIEIKAKQRLSMLEELDEEKREEAEFRLLNLNRSISATEGLSESYRVGPSYFLKLKDLDYNYDALWSDYIKPLLIEYLRGSYDFQEILGNLDDAYNTIDDTGDVDESDGQ